MKIFAALAAAAFLLFAAPAAAIPEEDLDVPYVPTPEAAVARMLDLAQVTADDYLIDLGSGDGRIAIAAAERGARALGVEIDQVRIEDAVAAAEFAGLQNRVIFRRQDLFETPIGEATVVTMYLLPDINLRLRPRLLTELRPGSRVVSHNFTMGDWRPDAEAEVGASHVYMWVVPAVVGGRWAFSGPDGETVLEAEQRFQEVSGTLGGAAMRDVVLRGTSLRFTVDTAGGPRTYQGVVRDAAIEADPAAAEGAARGWSARRLEE